MSVIKWRIYCETDSTWSYGILDKTRGKPVKCFENTAHTVNLNSQQKLDEIDKNKIVIVEEEFPTGGKFKAVCYKHVCIPGVNFKDYTFPYPISALAVKFQTVMDHKDDFLELQIGPDTEIGWITSDITTGETVLPVSESVLQNVSVGVYISLSDSVNSEQLGIIKEIDLINSTITVDNPVSYNFSVSSPTKVLVTLKSIDDFVIGYPSLHNIGESKIGSSYIPKGTILRVKYTNNGSVPVENYYNVEYMY